MNAISLLIIIVIYRGLFAMASFHVTEDLDSQVSDNKAHDLISTGPPPSPKCWRAAIALLQLPDVPWESATTVCTALSDESQKQLALAISQCVLIDMGKETYQTTDSNNHVVQECMKTPISPYVISECMKHLTWKADYVFIHYLTFIQSLCLRLTQELILQKQDELLRITSLTHTNLINQSMQQMTSFNQVLQNHYESLQEMQQIPERTTQSMNHSIAFLQGLPDLLQNHISRIIETNNKRQNEYLNEELSRVREEYSWISENLKDMVSIWTQFKSYISMQVLLQMVTRGYAMFALCRYFVGTLILIWAFTYPSRNHSLRGFLYGIFLSEILLEVLLSLSVRYEKLSEADQKWYAGELRICATLTECVVAVIGFIAIRLSNLVNRIIYKDSSVPVTRKLKTLPPPKVVYINHRNNNKSSDNFENLQTNRGIYGYTARSVLCSDRPSNMYENDHGMHSNERNDRFVPITKMTPNCAFDYPSTAVQLCKVPLNVYNTGIGASPIQRKDRVVSMDGTSSYDPILTGRFPELRQAKAGEDEATRHWQQVKTVPKVSYDHSSCYSSSPSMLIHTGTESLSGRIDLSGDTFYNPMTIEASYIEADKIMSPQISLTDDDSNNFLAMRNKKRRSTKADLDYHLGKKQKCMIPDREDDVVID